MNKKLIFASLLTLGLAAAPSAWADRGHDDDHGRGHEQDRGHQDRGWHGERERRYSGDRYTVNVYQAPRGYVRRDWHYGDRVPAAYRGTRYVVNDYRVYHLDPPPRGHRWVRVDNDVLLTAVTTGVVAAVVYGIFQ